MGRESVIRSLIGKRFDRKYFHPLDATFHPLDPVIPTVWADGGKLADKIAREDHVGTEFTGEGL